MPSTYLRHFGTISDWVMYAENNGPEDGPDNTRASVVMASPGWNGVSNKAEAFDLMCKGWPDGLAKMKAIMEKVYNVVRVESPEYEFHDKLEGSAPNIESFLHGIPEDMHALEPITLTAPPSFLIVQCEMFISCYTTPQQCMWAGACVFAAMELLKGQGCATSLMMSHSCVSSRGSGDYWQSAFPIPNNLDLDTLAFLFTHPATFRTIVFSAEEHETREIRERMGFEMHSGYGQPAKVKLDAAHAYLSIQRIVQNFQDHNEAHNTAAAQKLVNHLVETKFNSFTPTP